MKKIELEEKENLEDTFFNIKYRFEKESASFREFIYLMKALSEWNCEDIYEEDLIDLEELIGEEKIWFEDRKNQLTPLQTKEEKIVHLIRMYNRIIFELKQYKEIEEEIKENGYEKLIEKRKEKLMQIFKEMLEYKNKKYDETWNLRQFAEKISQYYNIYSDDLWNAVSAANMGSVQYDIEEDSILINEVESIMFVDDFYNLVTCEGDDYKENANYYRDFELEEGQTFSDLYKLEIEKFKKLFKAMLDYRNIEYDKNDNTLYNLKSKVIENYPYYASMLFHLTSPNPNITYIQELNSMEDVLIECCNYYKKSNEEEFNISYEKLKSAKKCF